MGTGPILMVVGTECPSEIEEEFSNWYSNKHVPDVLRFKGVKKATRYKILPPEQTIARSTGETPGEYPPYVATYEFEDWKAVENYNHWPERQAILRDWNENWATKGAKIKWRIFYEAIKTWEK